MSENTPFLMSVPTSWSKDAADDIAIILDACESDSNTGFASIAKLPDWCRAEWRVATDRDLSRIVESSGYFGGLKVENCCGSIVVVSETGTLEEMNFLADVVSLVMRKHDIESSVSYTYGQDDAGVAIIGPNGGGMVSVSGLKSEENLDGAGMALVMEQFADAVGWSKVMEMIAKAAAYHGQSDILQEAIAKHDSAGMHQGNGI